MNAEVTKDRLTGLLKYAQVLGVLCLTICAGVVAQAQEVMTCEDAIAIALANNYDIILSRKDSASAALDYSYRNMVFYPRVNATLGTNWLHNNQHQEYTDHTQREGNVATNNLNGSVSLNWTLFDGLKMFATRQKAEEYVHLGELTIKNQISNTIADVITTYYNIVREKQQLKAIEDQMSISEITLDLAQQKLDIGAGAKPQVLQSTVDLNARKAAHLQEETLIRELKERLVQLISPAPEGQDVLPSTNFEVSDSIPVDFSLSVDAIQRRVHDQNPLLQISAKNIEIANITVEELKADRYPTLEFGAAYNFNRASNSLAVNPFLPILNRNRGFNYGLTLSVPILNYRNTQRLIDQAQLDVSYQQLAMQNQQSQLRLSVSNAFQNFEFQRKALQLEEENISLAKENVDIILEAYRLGNSTYLELRESQKSLEDAYNRLIAARYDAKVAETELLRLEGSLVQ